MKLTNIETYVIKTGEPNLGGLFWFFIKLETDEGIVGWGETAVLYTLLGVEDGFEQNLKGYQNQTNTSKFVLFRRNTNKC